MLANHGGTLSLWLHDLTLTQNFSHLTASAVDPPIWSVVVEMHFYALLPLLALLIATVAGGRLARAIVAIVGLAVLAHLARSFLVVGDADPYGIWRLNLPGTFVFFTPGLLLAALRLRLQDRDPAWTRTTLGASDAWLLCALGLTALSILRPQVEALAVPFACFFAVGGCVLPLRRGRLTASLRWRPLAALGIASYSLYIWHVPLIMFVRDSLGVGSFRGAVLIAAPLAVAAAFVSYRLIESPFLRLRRQWASSAARKETAPRAPSEQGLSAATPRSTAEA